MCLKESGPRTGPFATRRRFDAVRLEDVADRRVANRVRKACGPEASADLEVRFRCQIRLRP